MSILTSAEEIINGQRAKDYGDARENHERIASLWSDFKKVEFSPEDVAVMMILLKIARFMENGYHEDTVVDIAGYAGVLEKMQLPAEERYQVAQPNGFVKLTVEQTKWDSLKDVPAGIYTVYDFFGDQWTSFCGQRYWKRRGEDGEYVGRGVYDGGRMFGPFREFK
ncbi:hypothetical protein SEA_JEEVES_62 [Mycobacterium phage Jeeves]|uniref:DUF6378 domain-containing protein n=1 Tax=Mycobacterium phage Jeeves TaxID=2652402 RepID=A0A5J6T498_9CAUD|nr:phosphofructokinase [Mycobacterium phage Jeeves]QFG04537.1 hypothetical protein SEA_JEEVES_62 [Mycobacterium phage Jeeves]